MPPKCEKCGEYHKCVNGHDALVEALKEALATINTLAHGYPMTKHLAMVKPIEDALKLAGEAVIKECEDK